MYDSDDETEGISDNYNPHKLANEWREWEKTTSGTDFEKIPWKNCVVYLKSRMYRWKTLEPIAGVKEFNELAWSVYSCGNMVTEVDSSNKEFFAKMTTQENP